MRIQTYKFKAIANEQIFVKQHTAINEFCHTKQIFKREYPL